MKDFSLSELEVGERAERKKLAEVTKILCKLRHSAKHCEYLEHNNHKTLFLSSSLIAYSCASGRGTTANKKKKKIIFRMVFWL
jgi:hypothetical protein